MRKYAVNDHTEDSLLHIADIHLVTNENIKNLSLGSYHYHKHFEIIVIQQGSVKIMVNYMIKEIANVVEYLRGISPVWDELEKGEIKHII